MVNNCKVAGRLLSSGMATQVTAGMVKELRQLTGAPMMDCKKALQDETVTGDIAKAVDWLRAKGIAKASKNADREAKEGVICLMRGNDKVTLVEVNSETDFVSRNEDFQTFVASVAMTAHTELGVGDLVIDDLMGKTASAPAKEQTVKDALIDAVNGIRENISIKRAMSIDVSGVDLVGSYVHGKVGMDALPACVEMGSSASVVLLSGAADNADEVVRRLAMHTVAARPMFATMADVPKAVRQREEEVSRSQMLEEGVGDKKPEIVEKIVAGKVNKRLGEMCLSEQVHVAEDGGPKVGKFLNKSGLKLAGFSLWTLGSS